MYTVRNNFKETLYTITDNADTVTVIMDAFDILKPYMEAQFTPDYLQLPAWGIIFRQLLPLLGMQDLANKIYVSPRHDPHGVTIVKNAIVEAKAAGHFHPSDVGS